MTRAKTQSKAFDLDQFLPYLLNQAAEATSRAFQTVYAEEYGLSRTQWRVLANLGKFGAMTARDICHVSHIEKTKVSRAIVTLEEAGLLNRSEDKQDRRAETLTLTERGRELFVVLGRRAQAFDRELRAGLGESRSAVLIDLLQALAALSQLKRPAKRSD
jgi:DNA-binding MarR family transcriptional regulator